MAHGNSSIETRLGFCFSSSSRNPASKERLSYKSGELFNAYLLFFDRGVVSVDHVTGHAIARTYRDITNKILRRRYCVDIDGWFGVKCISE